MTTSHLRDLVIANRILANEGVVDAFGHVSVRSPNNPNRYFMSRSRAPELITADDLMEFTLDGEATDLQGRTPYGERMIHGAVYESRPEVNAVVHNHAYEVIPFGVTGVPLRPIMHCCAVIGSDIPTWDIRDKFGEGDHLLFQRINRRFNLFLVQFFSSLFYYNHLETLLWFNFEERFDGIKTTEFGFNFTEKFGEYLL